MTVQEGEKVPAATFKVMGPDGPADMTSDELFAGKTVALFSVPGAFTPTCSAKHLPGFVEKSAELKAKGVDSIACTAANDVFVMDAWGKDQDVGEIMMLADGSADFAKALGLELDLTGRGMGMRAQRYSMVVKDGVIDKLNVEEGGAFEVSSAEHMLGQL
ncbi:MAG: peroxiredoxin [Rhodospirillaceae bacterium]|nr:peroxiredoxin [Rhodospirillaceae bacterium]|tara:strand:+ start:54937 stop:55416 length:480 start_codon:yes stop_codon:yes gene_type:complete